MGRLVIDGNSVYEIDEECAKNRRIPKECQIYEHLRDEKKIEDRKRIPDNENGCEG